MSAADVQGAVAALRQLADAMEQDAKLTASVDIEAEVIGHMIKTSVVLWSVAPGAVDQPPPVQWCQNTRPNHHGLGWRPCRTMLRDNGTCPNASDHRWLR